MTLGELIGEAVEWLYEFWPFRIVQDWEQGVRMRAGRATALLTSANGLFGTGIHPFWPRIGEVLTESVTVRTVEPDTQRLVSADGVEVSVSFAVAYRIKDLRAHWLKVHDHEETVTDRIRGAVGEAVGQLSWERLPGELPDLVEELAKKKMYGWGVELVDVCLANLSRTKTLHLMS